MGTLSSFFLVPSEGREMDGLPDDVLFEIIQSLGTLELSRMIRSSKELRRIVYAVLSLEHVKTFDSMMKSITCTRPPDLRWLLRYSAPMEMTSKLSRVKYTCGTCGRGIEDVACCDVCNPPRQQRVSRRLYPFRA